MWEFRIWEVRFGSFVSVPSFFTVTFAAARSLMASFSNFFFSASASFWFSSRDFLNILTKTTNIWVTAATRNKLNQSGVCLKGRFSIWTLIVNDGKPCSKGHRAGSSPKYWDNESALLPCKTIQLQTKLQCAASLNYPTSNCKLGKYLQLQNTRR